jgi:hypothetical protein
LAQTGKTANHGYGSERQPGFEQRFGTQTTQERSRAYPLRGHLSAVEMLTDKNNKPYAKVKLTYTRRDQREVTVTTMAFGKAFDDTQNLFKEGPVALYGTFERNVFRVISEALPPKGQAAAACLVSRLPRTCSRPHNPAMKKPPLEAAFFLRRSATPAL